MAHPVVLFDIGCHDAGRSREFYTTVFGWTSEPYGPLAHQLATGSDEGIQGFTTALGHEPRQYILLYIAVENIPASLARIESHGGKTLVPETPYPGGGTFAWFTDPSGNQMGLIKRP